MKSINNTLYYITILLALSVIFICQMKQKYCNENKEKMKTFAKYLFFCVFLMLKNVHLFVEYKHLVYLQ